MTKEEEYILEAECPCCGESVKFKNLDEVICSCGDFSGRISIDWECVREDND